MGSAMLLQFFLRRHECVNQISLQFNISPYSLLKTTDVTLIVALEEKLGNQRFILWGPRIAWPKSAS